LAVTVSIMSHLGVGALCFAFAGAFVFVSARQTDQRLGASEGGLIDAAPSGASADAPPSQAQPSPSVSAPTDRPADVNENVAPASAEAFSQASTDQPVADNLDATEPPPMIGPTSDPLAAPIFPQRKTASAAVAPASAVAAAHLSAESGHSSSSSASASAAAAVHSMGAARVRGTPGGRRDGFDLDGRGIPIPEYPAESRRRREEGMVKLDLEILPDGTVGRIAIVDDGGYSRLAAASVTAARAAHFEPGTYDGRPCVCHLIVPYRFTLR
jgi:protein TonB